MSYVMEKTSKLVESGLYTAFTDFGKSKLR